MIRREPLCRAATSASTTMRSWAPGRVHYLAGAQAPRPMWLAWSSTGGAHAVVPATSSRHPQPRPAARLPMTGGPQWRC